MTAKPRNHKSEIFSDPLSTAEHAEVTSFTLLVVLVGISLVRTRYTIKAKLNPCKYILTYQGSVRTLTMYAPC